MFFLGQRPVCSLYKVLQKTCRKQDPSDIDAIIKKINLDFLSYKEMVLEASMDFVGNRKIFILSALLAAENHYTTDQVNELQESVEGIFVTHRNSVNSL